MAESSRLLSPNKKKVKRSKLAGVAPYETTFQFEWKKKFLSSQTHQMMLAWTYNLNYKSMMLGSERHN